jgi:threonylcarbamoyladenosine tRNA methylthiotransferase MtaB
MNRAYTAGDYAVLIERIKSSVSGIAITTDVMVGFPGESEDNFGNTVGLVKKILPLKVHIFAYSPREGTAAYSRFKQGLDPKIIKERSAYLRKISFECSLDYKRRFLNRIMPVLIESKTESGYWQGYTGNYIRVSFKSALKLQNTLIQVKLKKIIKDCVLVQRRGVILKKGGA